MRAFRREQHKTQQALGGIVGLSGVRIGELERGYGAAAPLATWILLGLGLDRPLAVTFSAPRDPAAYLADAGHLDLQESVLRLVRRNGWSGTFELPTRPADPSRSIDVLAQDDRARRLLVLECWNRFGDLGAAARASNRKVAEASEAAVAIGGERPYSVHLCWLIRPSASNRAIVARYPAIFRSRFAGSSLGWARALTTDAAPPREPGIVWLDPATGRVSAVRLRT